ncbi:hypothetical protein SAMN04488128_105138 [Chitinophaga eiseniae]|uniref:Uncharacterized protein n=1 Tax=Chitinophaga eiseniae TaxID=634771 RepID=A0A1T4TIE8_9BACT|nr:hypothetical protein [Chitinophaga eiseniae]SKA40194.1 hypothetical protein SAMN04488128_105138 [Chitinophaga eiseniae]
MPVELYGKRDSITAPVARKRMPVKVIPTLPRTPWITIHGNVSYDLFYQSNVDTPYVEHDIYQHTVQTVLDLTVKNRYPLHLTFSTQMGNSSLFRNITGINLQYTNRDLKQMLLARAREWDGRKLKQLQELEKLRSAISGIGANLSALRGWLSSQAQLQRLVEEKEKNFYGITDSVRQLAAGLGNVDQWRNKLKIDPNRIADKWKLQEKITAVKDSLKNKLPENTFEAYYHKKQQEADSLTGRLVIAEKKYRELNTKYGQRTASLVDAITHSKTNGELVSALDRMNLPDSMLPKGYRTLLSVRSFGIGRTMVNYSELTAKDISITGVQLEYNPSFYLAVASGAVDYRFRNYIVKENRGRQYLNLVRAGLGMKEGNNVILTYYTGKKDLYNMNTQGADPATYAGQHIMGIALEGQWRLNRATCITAEMAKSSMPYYARAASHESPFNSMLNFSSRHNEAYALKFSTVVEKTQTNISGMFKQMGRDFQSFSLYTTGSRQTAWNIRIDQPFFRRQLTISAAIRKNDYVTYMMPANYHSNTVFKSLQATWRKKHWPVITVGYQPSSQLMKLSDDYFVEHLFYTLTGTASHYYSLGGIKMNSVISYSQFYNRQTDSNFVYFNSKNLMASQTLFLDRFTLNGQLSAAVNQEYGLYGAGADVSWKALHWLELGGGMKYNRQTVYGLSLLGYSGHSKFRIPWIGEIGLYADKGFIPGAHKKLVTNNTGRVTYTRTF